MRAVALSVVLLNAFFGTRGQTVTDSECSETATKCMALMDSKGANPLGGREFVVHDFAIYCELVSVDYDTQKRASVVAYIKRNGKLEMLAACVRKLSLHCRFSAASLADVLDYTQIQKGVDALCANITLLRSTGDCLKEQSKAMAVFAGDEARKISRRVVGHAQNARAVMTIQCRYITSIIERLRRNVSDVCGASIGHVYADFMSSFVPRNCQLYTRVTTGPPGISPLPLDTRGSKTESKTTTAAASTATTSTAQRKISVQKERPQRRTTLVQSDSNTTITRQQAADQRARETFEVRRATRRHSAIRNTVRKQTTQKYRNSGNVVGENGTLGRLAIGFAMWITCIATGF